jgi:dynactin complex subunit
MSEVMDKKENDFVKEARRASETIVSSIKNSSNKAFSFSWVQEIKKMFE